MAVFEKEFAWPRKVLGRDPEGNRKLEDMTPEKIAQMVKTGNEMLADGLLIPAPYGHRDENGVYPVPVTKLDLDAKKVPWSLAANSGFYRSFYQRPDGVGVALLEADGDPESPDTHAGRVNKTFSQVSPFFMPEWTDGLGKVRKMAPLHICVTNKAANPGQAPFKLVPENQNLALAMSFDEDDIVVGTAFSNDPDPKFNDKKGPEIGEKKDDESKSGTATTDSTKSEVDEGSKNDDQENDKNTGNSTCLDGAYVAKIVELGKSRLGLTFPDDTNETNLLDRLLAILTSQPEKETTGELPEEKPEDSEPRSPTIMALDLEAVTKRATALLTEQIAARKNNIKNRIDGLVKTGRVGRAYADANLVPQIEGLAFSLDDLDDNGAFPKTAIEMSLDTLEQLPSPLTPAGFTPPEGSSTLPHPPGFQSPDAEAEVDPKIMQETLDRLYPNR